MTKEERRSLINRLRTIDDHPWELTKQAADEIERLARELQSAWDEVRKRDEILFPTAKQS